MAFLKSSRAATWSAPQHRRSSRHTFSYILIGTSFFGASSFLLISYFHDAQQQVMRQRKLRSKMMSTMVKDSPFSNPLALSTMQESREGRETIQRIHQVASGHDEIINVLGNYYHDLEMHFPDESASERARLEQNLPIPGALYVGVGGRRHGDYDDVTAAEPTLPSNVGTTAIGERAIQSLSGFRDSWYKALSGNTDDGLSNNDDGIEKNDVKDAVVFWHVPKSGGSTVKDIMGMCHRLITASSSGIEEGHDKDTEIALVAIGGDVTEPNRPKLYVNVDTSTVEGLQRAKKFGLAQSGLADLIVSSHLFETADLFDENHKGRLFAVFRHPIARIVSQFSYLAYATWEKTYNPVFANMTLEEYVKRDDLQETNWMTRYLTNQPTGKLTERNFEVARDIVRHKFIVGLTEKMEESMERFEKVFGWTYHVNPVNQELCRKDLLTPSGRSNRNANKKHKLPPPNSETYRVLTKKNWYDIQLYAFIERLFVQQEQLVKDIPDGYRLINATCCKCQSPPTC